LWSFPGGTIAALKLTASERGYGKKTAVEQYPLKRRGGQGVRIINLDDKDRVCSIAKVREE